jgi:mannose-6-phosphate isomerase-like protein (cupin superfamily)
MVLSATHDEGGGIVPSALTWDSEMAQAVQEYAANPLFRSASFDELVINDNPYRRPVRPDDLEWLEFDRPISRADSSRLSSLLGHRMLLNIYDSRLPLIPAAMSKQRRKDFELFYDSRTRSRGERIRPFLEHHLFDYVRDTQRPPGLEEALRRLACERAAATARLLEQVHGAGDRMRAARMTALQIVGEALAPTGEGPATAPVPPAGLRQRISQLAVALDLVEERHSYYQFYLPSTLALMNYLGACARDPRDACVFAGALTAYRIDLHAKLDGLEDAARELAGAYGEPCQPGAAEAGWHDIAGKTVRRYGAKGSREFTRGLQEFAELLASHDEDLKAQLRLVEGTAALQHKAHRLYSVINEQHIPVELDTFVESWEECSTTHVHDDDRLVVVESGEMEFWACLGQRIKLGPGDMFFVPKHRLHGSVVRSGTCVYHQPVITEELEALCR